MGWQAVVNSALVSSSVVHVVLVVMALSRVDRAPGVGRWTAPLWAGVAGAFAVLASRWSGVGWIETLTVVGIVWAATSAAVVVWPQFTPLGAMVWASFLLMGGTSLVWGAQFLGSLHLSSLTLVLMWVTAGVGVLSVPSSLVQTLEGWEALFRRSWSRPNQPMTAWRPLGTAPRVCIQVPTHAEPPELVIETLDALSRLRYPNFEVLVIDNNTTDETLWRPLERHCQRLGSRFRFLHVEGISGAKAGALNWSMKYLDPAVELIGVVDADYQVAPDWLAHVVGYFDDPSLGFVQCPHAYRDFEWSQFGRMANAEYHVFFSTSMVSLSEHGAGITVGTMSLIRKQALVDAGGWAEWCLTEDSELAIRIHARGYSSVYLSKPYGWGLIPETFADYKKQRFRWTYGPVQEFQRHLRLFLPQRRLPARAAASQLTARQRVHHGNHGLDVIMVGIRLLMVPIASAAMLSMVWHRESVAMPPTLWIAATSVLVGSVLMRWTVFRDVVGATLTEAFGGTISFLALSHVISVASLSAVLGRPATWQRTNKFRQIASLDNMWDAAGTETVLAVLCLSVAGIAIAAMPHPGMALALALGVAWQGVSYATAPLMSLIAELALGRKRPDRAFTRAELA